MPEGIPNIGRLIWNNKPVGTGFLVHASGLVATCYHVVRVAGDSPEGQRFIFEFLNDGQTRRAIVTGKLDPQHDIALLQIAGPLPRGVEPVPLIESAATRSGMNFQVIGFGELNDPAHQYRYSSATGVVVGPTDRDGVELLQLESKQVLRGMSGGPVIVDALKGVVGLVSARYNIDPSTGLWMRDTVWAARSEQISALHPELKTVKPRQPIPRWVPIISFFLAVVLGFSIFWAWSQRLVPPPENGFNVLVADFETLDEAGNHIRSDAGSNISRTVFEVIESASVDLDPALIPNMLGPDRIPAIQGDDQAERAQNARTFAEKYNATILVYGIVRQGPDWQQIELSFEIPARSFNYGSEIIGPNRLGQPIPLTAGLQGSYETNVTFDARTQALRYLVMGLAHFSINDYERAVIEFRSAANLKNWKKGEGKEVAYMFIGSTLLRDYDLKTGSEQNLVEAKQAFIQAQAENAEYARVYLGLGAVAREEAILHTSGPCNGEVDINKLAEADQWYQQSLQASDQSQNAYVPAKAYYGLGQIKLLVFCNLLEGSAEAKVDSQAYFSKVIQIYLDNNKTIDLAWFAGNAYLERGYLYYDEQNWGAMAADTEQAIAIFSGLPGDVIQKWLARQWAQKGYAETRLCDLEAAQTAYQKAFISADNAGAETVSPEELEKWQGEFQKVEEMISEGSSCE